MAHRPAPGRRSRPADASPPGRPDIAPTFDRRQPMINYQARWVIPVTRPPLPEATVSVNGSRIAYVGARADAPTGQEVELGDAVILPVLINAHTHLELTAMRGFLRGLDFVPWIRMLDR